MVQGSEKEPVSKQTSEEVLMHIIQSAQSSSFDPKAFLKDAGILCQRGDAAATYNPASNALEITDVLKYLRSVAEQHKPEVLEAAASAMDIYSGEKHSTPEEQKLVEQTLLLVTSSEDDIQTGLKAINVGITQAVLARDILPDPFSDLKPTEQDRPVADTTQTPVELKPVQTHATPAAEAAKDNSAEKITLTPEVQAKLEPLFNQLREAVNKPHPEKPYEEIKKLEKAINAILAKTLSLKEDELLETVYAERGHINDLFSRDTDFYWQLITSPESDPTQKLFAQDSPQLRGRVKKARKQYQTGSEDYGGVSDTFYIDIAADLDSAVKKAAGINYIPTEEDIIEDIESKFEKYLEETPSLSVEALSQAFIDRNHTLITQYRALSAEYQKKFDFLKKEVQKTGINLDVLETKE